MCVELSVVLPRHLDAGARARRSIERFLGSHTGTRLLDDVRIVASELVNNAVVHGCGRIVLALTVSRDVVRVRVTDDGSGETPAIRERRNDNDTGGWGLRLVDHLAAAWGVDGRTVWADLPAATVSAATHEHPSSSSPT
jgi:anti-sigma regulatory factor (Ser/Thr protein kinase)